MCCFPETRWKERAADTERSHYQEQRAVLKKIKTELSDDPAVLLWGVYPKKTIIKKMHVP